MWQRRLSDSLRDEIEAVLVSVSDEASLYELVKEPLTKARRGLCAEIERNQPWPLLPLLACEAVCGRYEHALPAAAAFQLLIAAGDVFDDIEDADSTESLSTRYGAAIATNVATTLLILAEKVIVRLKDKDVDDSTTIRIIDAVSSFYTTACVGQHRDLSFGSEMAISEEEYLRVIGMKSASQVECSCRVGAILGHADQGFIDKFSAFGHNLGMAAQISNDIQGITRGNDILRHKITFPVIFALAQTNRKAEDQSGMPFAKQFNLLDDPEKVRDFLFRTGAIHYATIKMEFYKQRAREIITEMETAGVSVGRLKLFVE